MFCFWENCSNPGNSLLSTAVVREAFSPNLEHFVPDWPGLDNLLHLLWNINLRIAKWNSENSVGGHLEPSWWQPKPKETIMSCLNRDPSLFWFLTWCLPSQKLHCQLSKVWPFQRKIFLPWTFIIEVRVCQIWEPCLPPSRRLLRKSIAKNVWGGKTWS